MRRLLALILGVATLVCPAASAGVAPAAWLPPTQLAEPSGSGIRAPDVAANANGAAVAVWAGGESGILARYRPAGGPWQATAQLAACGASPRVGLDAEGNAIALWNQCDVSGSRIVAAMRTVDGVWHAPVPLSTPGRHSAYPQLAVASSGHAVASWAESDGTWWVIQASTIAPRGSWTPAAQLSSVGGSSLDSQALIGSNGAALVAWVRFDAVGPMVWVASSEGSGWTASVNLSQPGAQGSAPALAIDNRGDAIAVWNENGHGRSSFRKAAGSWQKSGPFPWHDARDVVFDGNGNAFAVWSADDAIRVSERPPSGGWRAPALVADGAPGATSLDIAFGEQGLVTLWTRHPSSTRGLIEAAYRTSGATWETPLEVAAESLAGEPRYGVADGVVAAWDTGLIGGSVAAALLDAADPYFRLLRTPPRGQVGRPVVLEAVPHDVSRTRVAWRFGDARAALGRRVAHVYRARGRYQVVVTLTDAAGHTTSARRTIRISRSGR